MMKKLLNPFPNKAFNDVLLLFLRVAVGLLLLSHGYPKLLKLISGQPISFASIMGMGPTLSLALAMFAEFFCALFVMFGLLTRFAAIPIVFTFLVIVTLVHGADPLPQRELPYLYLIVYVIILFSGPGKYSLDYLLFRKRK